MSLDPDSSEAQSQTKKFGKGEREIPHHSQKAKKYYPVEDESRPKRVCSVEFCHQENLEKAFQYSPFWPKKV